VQVSGRQYKVVPGDVIIVEKMPVEVGEEIALHKVLLVAGQNFTAIGAPVLTRSKVMAQVQEQTRTEKVIIFKKKRRKGYKRTQGHKSEITVLLIKHFVCDLDGHVTSPPPSSPPLST